MFYPKVMVNSRERQVYALYGQAKYTGGIDGPFFPSLGILGKAALGPEYSTTGVAVGGGGAATTSAATAVGATTVGITVSSGAFAVNDLVQIEASADTTQSEVRKITAIAGTAPNLTLTLDQGLSFAHASGVAATQVQSPYTHTFRPTTSQLTSLTIEQCIGGYQSEQYPGCRVSKLALKSAAGNSELAFTADVEGLTPSILDTPSVPTFPTDSPLVFSQATTTILGTAVGTVSDLSVELDNGLKPTWTHGLTNAPKFLTPVSFAARGTLKLVFESLDDPNVGYFLKTLPPSGPAGSAAQGALEFKWLHSDNTGIDLYFPTCNFAKYKDDVKLEEIVLDDISWEAAKSQATGYSARMQITNTAYLQV